MGGPASGREIALRPGDLVEGRYRIIKTLGQGGMGTVFLAEHTLIKRRVALKILHNDLATDSDVVERFMNEARAAGTLGHPNIVESTDMGFTHEHVPYIAFEYLEGALLTDEIYRVGGLPVRRAVFVAQQIASALAAAHNAGIIHRDLKSDNVFLTDKDDAADHVKVLDFGISRFLSLDDEKTRNGMVMGTPEFMAPEQISAPDSIDKRADIYALGVILYEMLTARRPFSGDEDPRQLMHRIVNDEPPPMQRAEVSDALEQYILEQLLAKDRDDRPQSMLDVEEALGGFIGQDYVPRRRSRPIAGVDDSDAIPRAATARPSSPASSRTELPARLPRAPGRPYALYGIAAGGALVGIVGLVLAFTREPETKIVRELVPAPAVAAGSAAPPPPPPPDPKLAKVAVELDANVPDAKITFRRRVSSAPTTLQLTPSDILEVVEVAAPGHKTMRYWLTFDRATKLVAQLVPGEGFAEATDDETLIALGEKAAPPPPPPPAPEPTPEPAPEPEAVAPTPPPARKKNVVTPSDEDRATLEAIERANKQLTPTAAPPNSAAKRAPKGKAKRAAHERATEPTPPSPSPSPPVSPSPPPEPNPRGD